MEDLTDEQIREICRRYNLSVVTAHGIRDGLGTDVRAALATSVRIGCWPAVEALLAHHDVVRPRPFSGSGVQFGSGNVQTNHY